MTPYGFYIWIFGTCSLSILTIVERSIFMKIMEKFMYASHPEYSSTLVSFIFFEWIIKLATSHDVWFQSKFCCHCSSQVYAQPLFAINEKWIGSRWPTSSFNKIYTIRFPCSRKGSLHLTINRLFLRPIFVVITTAVAMMFPFFNAILGLLGSVSFWPLTVYFPISMYIVQAKIKRGSCHWFGLQALGFVCLIVTVVSGIGSVAGMVEFLKKARLFHIEI